MSDASTPHFCFAMEGFTLKSLGALVEHCETDCDTRHELHTLVFLFVTTISQHAQISGGHGSISFHSTVRSGQWLSSQVLPVLGTHSAYDQEVYGMPNRFYSNNN